VLLSKPLAGRVIAVPESRQLEKLAAMLEEKGATALRFPLVDTRDAPDARVVEAWLGELCAGGFDDLILMTGEGLSRLLGFAPAGSRQ
jgi:uroporphyrinogen-III synthase